jgi:two-component system cell cycle sensor histidine kinase/response regulator CckA
MSILIVEDESDMREFMKACLELKGYDVITAANGLDGLQRYEEYRDQVRVVVTDLDMPRMNGDDMIQEIFKMAPEMKVIVASGRCTGDADTNDSWPPASRLQKPFSSGELAEAVNLVLSVS